MLLIDLFAGYWWWQSRRERNLDPLIFEASRKYKVQPALIKAVVWQESRFDPDARGLAGEIGLMQIRKVAALEWATVENIPWFRHEHLSDSRTNILCGTWYLRKVLERYTHADYCLPYALADYNAGRSRVIKWNDGAAETNSLKFIEQIEFPSTRNYVRSVMNRYARYLPEYDVPAD